MLVASWRIILDLHTNENDDVVWGFLYIQNIVLITQQQSD